MGNEFNYSNVSAENITNPENTLPVVEAIDSTIQAVQGISALFGRYSIPEIIDKYQYDVAMYVSFNSGVPLNRAVDIVQFAIPTVNMLGRKAMDEWQSSRNKRGIKALYPIVLETIWRTFSTDKTGEAYFESFYRYTQSGISNAYSHNSNAKSRIENNDSAVLNFAENEPVQASDDSRLKIIERYNKILTEKGYSAGHVLGAVAWLLSTFDQPDEHGHMKNDYLPVSVLLYELHLLPHSLQKEDKDTFLSNNKISLSHKGKTYTELLNEGFRKLELVLEINPEVRLREYYSNSSKTQFDSINNQLVSTLFGDIEKRYKQPKEIFDVIKKLQSYSQILLDARSQSKNPFKWFRNEKNESIRNEKLQEAFFIRLCLDSYFIHPLLQILEKFDRNQQYQSFRSFLNRDVLDETSLGDEKSLNHSIRISTTFLVSMIEKYQSLGLSKSLESSSFGETLIEALVAYTKKDNQLEDILLPGREKLFLQQILLCIQNDQQFPEYTFMSQVSTNCHNALSERGSYIANSKRPLTQWIVLLNSIFISKNKTGDIYQFKSLHQIVKGYIDLFSKDFRRLNNRLPLDYVLQYLFGSIQLMADLTSVDTAVPEDAEGKEQFLSYLLFYELLQPKFKGIKQVTRSSNFLETFKNRKSSEEAIANYSVFIELVKTLYPTINLTGFLELLKQNYQSESQQLDVCYALYCQYKKDVFANSKKPS